MLDYLFVLAMAFTLAVSLWGMFSKPIPKTKQKYQGVKDLSAWHKNVGTRWNG